MSASVAIETEDLVHNQDEISPTILNPRSGRIFVMNKVGERVLDLCNGKSLDEIVSVIEEEFEGATHEEIVSDINEFLQQAGTEGVIRWQQR